MKTKIFLLAGLLAVLCTACETNEPIEKQLIGKWSEPYHVNSMVKSIVFNSDGTALYTWLPDTTLSVIPTGGGICWYFNYTIKGDKLYCVADENNVNPQLQPELITGFRIEENVLTLDTFHNSIDLSNKPTNPLILYKQ